MDIQDDNPKDLSIILNENLMIYDNDIEIITLNKLIHAPNFNTIS
jgi:hypothetical protein